ncbi:MAG TPA: alpha/beta hydrolase-fold protein [Pirellulales bacterium]
MRGKQRLVAPLAIAITIVVATAAVARADEGGLQFAVSLDRAVAEQTLPAQDGRRAVTGRLYVFLSQRGGQPISGPNWFKPEPFAGVDVRDVQPGDARRVNGAASAFPDSLAKLPAGKYRVQALLDHDFYSPDHSHGVGNFYSEVKEIEHDPARPATVELLLNQTIKAETFPTRDWVKEIVLRSELLSQFHKREVVERASVVLPADYAEHPNRRYPVIYEITGFGGTHVPPPRLLAAAPAADEGETDFIRVTLDGKCKWGHHVYADSATNGPRGAALVREMIPHIDATYRTIAQSSGRFVTGHSSGGWTSLWLQVTYPDMFGGCFSTSPDPVDFRDFQRVDLYAYPPLSLYFDEKNEKRPIARQGETPELWFVSFGLMDDVIGRGGQLRSFEATFSPLDSEGLPRKLWDRKTGQIDPQVAKAWEKYDIRLILMRNWQTLGPKLQGKLHIYTGGLDTFYLEGAVEKLIPALKELGSDAEVVVVPGKGHGGLRTQELVRQFRRQMTETVRAAHPDTP